MKHQISLNSTEQSNPNSFFQQLSDTASENLSGGSDGTCSACTVDDLFITDDDEADTPSGYGVVNIRFKVK
ncbi:MAG: hypothetical protein ACFB2W_25060 [Leptolyngbyaceae cyanobacterium]